MPFSKVFDNIKTHINSERNFDEFLKEQEMATSRGYSKSGIYQNIFSSPIIIKILLPKKPNYQADFINYKDNFPEKVINKTFQRKGSQQELPTTQALS